MRSLLKDRPSSRRQPSTRNICRSAGCTNDTTNNKPFCIEHITSLPYINSISNILTNRTKELNKATRHRKHIDPNGLVSQDIIETVRNKNAVTIQKLAQIAEIDIAALENYLKILSKHGLLRVIEVGSYRGTIRRLVMLAS